jgi:hypothetical protein
LRNGTAWSLARLVATSIGLLTAVPARAEGPPESAAPKLWAVLSYAVDPQLSGCPGEAEFRDSVVKQLGYDPFRSDATHRIAAEVKASGDGIEGRLGWADAHGNYEGERRLASSARNCGEFVKGMTFALAVQIQLLNTAAAAALPTALPALPQAPPGPPPPTKPATVPAERAIILGLGPTGELGSVPSFTGGLRLFAGVRRGALSVEFSAEATLPVTLRQPDGTGFSANTLGATIAPCAHRDCVSLCAVGMLGLLAVRGFGVDDARSPSSLFGKVGLRLAFDPWLSSRWTAGIHVDGLANLTPSTVSLNELPVWTTPTLTLIVGVDVAAILR